LTPRFILGGVVRDALLDELRRSAVPRLVLEADPGSADVGSVGLLPGSFDPLTAAHAALAEAALDRAELVILVYSVRILPKEGPAPPALLSERERLSILETYCRGKRRVVLGLASHGLIVEQVRAARERFPHARLFVVAGSDKLAQLFDPKWYADRGTALDALFGEASVLYAERAGQEGLVSETVSRPDNTRWGGHIERLEIAPELAAVSARRVRDLIEKGTDPHSLMPEAARAIVTRASSRLVRDRHT
jgi:nicotinamide-nucleotide adenylyltransferase